MNDQELDNAIRSALLDAAARDFDEAQEQVDPAASPSPRHQKEMRAMLRDPLRWARSRTQRARYAPLGWAAVFLLAALLGLSVLIQFIPTAQADEQHWYIEWEDSTHLTFHYTGEYPNKALPHYEITALPDGFEEVDRFDHSPLIQIVYQDADGNKIIFTYHFLIKSSKTFYSLNEQDFVEPIQVDGMPGLFLGSHNPDYFQEITWIDEEACIQLSIRALLSKEDILRMARSLSLVKEPEIPVYTNFR